MAKERIVATKFCTDNYIAFLDPIEKLLFLYFITNPLTNISGVYEITLKQIGFDTGIDPDMIRKILDRFERDGKIFYRVGWIGIRNFIKNQHTNSEDVQFGIKRELNLAPQEIIIATFGRDSLEGGGRVGGISHILNLTKLNLTKADSVKKPNTDVPDSSFKEISYEYEDKPIATGKAKEARGLVDWYGKVSRETFGGDPRLSYVEKGYFIVVKLLKKYTHKELKDILTWYLETDKFNKFPQISAALSADTLRLYSKDNDKSDLIYDKPHR